MALSDREAGEVLEALKNMEEEVKLLRKRFDRLDDKLESKFVTRLEFRVVGLILGFATGVLGVINYFRSS
jgi:predicted nuclease with TOPRIM domain